MNRTVRIHLLEIKYEFLKALRLPAYSLPTLLFPLAFYLFYGVVFGAHQAAGTHTAMSTYMLATFGSFGIIGASLFGFGVSVAVERGHGWLEVKRTTPMPISAWFTAKAAMAMLFSTIIVCGLATLGVTLANVHLTITQFLSLLGVLVAGSTTFCALGLAIGYFAGPSSAPAIVNLIYLPLSFLSGLWVPIWVLPKALQRIAFFLPPFHLSQLALKTLGAGRPGGVLFHVIALLIATVLFVALAYKGYRRDEGKLYG